jgi:mRNA interferase MazF
VRFAFSDRSGTKLRPAVVLASTERGDRVLCQITSNPRGDAVAIPITSSDFAAGSLRLVSYASPGKLFTARQSLLVSQAGILKAEARDGIVESVVTLLRLGR